MPQNILNKIVADKKKEVERKKQVFPLDKLKIKLNEVPAPRDFKKSVFSKKGPSIIAEIKRFSPSAGTLRDSLNPVKLARLYEKSGASAISVLVDKKFFGGSLKDLSEVKKEVSLPVLAKEFILDEYQIYEARVHGADAILLIARPLEKEKLFKLYRLAEDLKMSCIVEVHSPEDIEKAAHLLSSVIVGINNRNLENFQVDLTTTERILNLIPSSHLVISESGIKSSEDMKWLRERGVSAFLVGEAILRSSDPGKKLQELLCG